MCCLTITNGLSDSLILLFLAFLPQIVTMNLNVTVFALFLLCLPKQIIKDYIFFSKATTCIVKVPWCHYLLVALVGSIPLPSLLSSPSPSPSLLSSVGGDKHKAAPKQRTVSSTGDHDCHLLLLHLLMDGMNYLSPLGLFRDRTVSYTSQMLHMKSEEQTRGTIVGFILSSI